MSTDRENKPKYSFYVEFPDQWDDVFGYMDNAITQWCQRCNNTFLKLLDKIVVVGTSIELGIIVTFFFFYLGIDSIAIAAASVMMSLVVVTQIPKRFMWRSRPYVVGRAKKLCEGALTSSFPSRAVTCCIVYSYLLAAVIEIVDRQGKDPVARFSLFWTSKFMLFTIWSICWTSIARIGIGVHYASDCLAGVVQSGVVCYIAETTYYIIVNSCCQGPAPFHEDRVLLSHHINWRGLSSATMIGVVVVCILNSRIVQYWKKMHFLLGLLYPVLTGLFLFCCGYHILPRVNINQVSIPRFILAAVIPLLLLVIGKCLPNSSGKATAASFLVLDVAGTALIIWHRVFQDFNI